MKKDFYWKIILILLLCGLSIWLAHPIKEKIHLGLDLQGGMHLILDVEAEKAVESTMDRYVVNLREAFKKDNIESAIVERDKNDILINYDPSKAKDIEKRLFLDQLLIRGFGELKLKSMRYFLIKNWSLLKVIF